MDTAISAVPLPDCGCTVAQPASARASHAHALLARTSTTTRAPAPSSAFDGPDMLKAQGAASCPMSARWSPTAIEPRRADGSPFADTR
jgi:hypothetical protein